MTTLRLREHTDKPGVALTPRQVDLLRRRFRCRVTLTDVSGERYLVRPREQVGVLVDGDTTVIVKPKMSIARVLFLLAYAVDPPEWQEDVALVEADTLTDSVAMLFTALCDRALRNGILRGYRHHEERVHTVRGRIDFTEQLRVSPGRDLPLAVAYQEHDEDVLENRLLRAALAVVSALPVHSEHIRRSLNRLRRAFTAVTPVEFDPRHVPAVLWTRLNRHYRPAVDLARLILTGTEVDLKVGAVRTPGLVMDMNTVFEHFVRTATRHTLGLTEEEFPVGRNAQLMLDEAGRVVIEPDLSRWVDGRCRFVGELKYRYGSESGAAPNLYQSLAYAVAAGVPDVTLVYADGPGEQAHYLPNVGVRIHVRHLDLDVPPADLLRQIRVLADHIDGLATRFAATPALRPSPYS